MTCKSDTFAPSVVPSVQVEPQLSSDAECASGDRGLSPDSGDRVQTNESVDHQHDIPEWLRSFTDGVMEEDTKPIRR